MLSFLPLIVIVVVFYFIAIRPQQARRKAQAAQMQAAGPGTEVMLTSGIFGTIVSKTDEHVFVEIAPGVQIKILPAAISTTVTKPGDDVIGSDAPSTDDQPNN
jgi:preprotein translocase subunit YajC